MLVNYRTYTSAIAILLKGILDQNGFTEITGEAISTTIDVVLVCCVILFRYLATKKQKKATT